MKNEFSFTRVINAPRNVVFKAWTDPVQLAKWWGPAHFTNPVCELDPKPSGVILVHMLAPDGNLFPMDGYFTEIQAPEKLVFVCGPLEKDGQHPFKTVITVYFKDLNGKTALTIEARVSEITPTAAPYLSGMNTGWNESLDKLQSMYTPSDEQPIVVERILNAPVAVVWNALTNREAMKEWYFDLAAFTPEVGFEFQFSGGTKEKQYLHLCKITELIPEKKISYTWRYQGYEGNSLVSFELFAIAGKTKIILTHRGLHSFPADNKDFAKTNFMAGWNHIIGISLPAYVEKLS